MKMGLLAAGVAALIAAPFTGGATLVAYAAVAGIVGGGLAAAFGGAGGGGGEGGAGGDDIDAAFMAHGGIVRGKANGGSDMVAANINEVGTERIIVPYGTYVATAADTKRSNDLAAELITEVKGLRGDLNSGADQPVRLVVGDNEFAATIVNSAGIGPFGAISRLFG